MRSPLKILYSKRFLLFFVAAVAFGLFFWPEKIYVETKAFEEKGDWVNLELVLGAEDVRRILDAQYFVGAELKQCGSRHLIERSVLSQGVRSLPEGTIADFDSQRPFRVTFRKSVFEKDQSVCLKVSGSNYIGQFVYSNELEVPRKKT